MQLRRVSVENYKAFVAKDEIELRPLTVVFGYNSSGKSALVRLLPMLANLSSPAKRSFGALSGGGLRDELDVDFGDLSSKLSSEPLRIGLTWGEGDAAFQLSFQIRPIVVWKLRTHVVEVMHISDQSASCFIELAWEPGDSPERGQADSRKYGIFLAGSPRVGIGSAEVSFQGLALEILSVTHGEQQSAKAAQVDSALHKARELLASLGQEVVWLKANRKSPENFVRPRLEGLRADGSGAASILAWDSLCSTGELASHVSSWYEAATGYVLNVEPVAAGDADLCSVSLSPKQGTAVKIPIRDTGEGMSHVLPVLTLVALAAKSSAAARPICCIEHPELHLHSQAHASLADHFCSSIANSGARRPTFVVETHSESFLLQLQLAILKKQIGHEDVVLHWVRQESDGTSWIDHIKFNSRAEPCDMAWPPGLFEETHSQAQEILALRKAEG